MKAKSPWATTKSGNFAPAFITLLRGDSASEQSLELRGMLAYVNSVEPSFLARLSRKYGSEVIRRIQIFAG